MGISLRYPLLVSVSLHCAALALFGFTFGTYPYLRHSSPRLEFWGHLLTAAPSASEGTATPQSQRRLGIREGTVPQAYWPVSATAHGFFWDREDKIIVWREHKPAVFDARAVEKSRFVYAAAPMVFEHKKDSTVMIHPLLPYQLQLYFQDRQAVHLELMFKIVASDEKRYVIIKRKISSGNLDADLLCSRYLGHYLFIQQARFAPEEWQTVKIDLSK